MKIATKLLIATLTATAMLGVTVAVPAQATTASAVQAHPSNAETTQTAPQPNKRSSQLGVWNKSSHVIWVKVTDGHLGDNGPPPPPPFDKWWLIQPGARAFISGDGGTGVTVYDVRVFIKSDGGGSAEYEITANNTWLATEGSTSFYGRRPHYITHPKPGASYTQLGTIDNATLLYDREVGGTEFWNVNVDNKT